MLDFICYTSFLNNITYVSIITYQDYNLDNEQFTILFLNEIAQRYVHHILVHSARLTLLINDN